MLNFTTNIPELDLENHNLFRAAAILQSLGNSPGLSVNDFYDSLLETDYDRSDHESVTLAAIAIETMMTADTFSQDYGQEEPTIH